VPFRRVDVLTACCLPVILMLSMGHRSQRSDAFSKFVRHVRRFRSPCSLFPFASANAFLALVGQFFEGRHEWTGMRLPG